MFQHKVENGSNLIDRKYPIVKFTYDNNKKNSIRIQDISIIFSITMLPTSANDRNLSIVSFTVKVLFTTETNIKHQYSSHVFTRTKH